ncbi:MAG: FkbM family methyltransferase [Acutalibacteraceae bacterium]|nr:FkbM family methyltransferase [Acutalibacteraceae bacterium]
MNSLNEASVWEFLRNTSKPIIIYGMGNGADKVLTLFERFGIKCSGVMASDDFVRGQSYKEFTVQRLSYFEERYGEVVIAVAFGTQIDTVIDHIKALAKKHTVIVPNVPVYGDEIFDDEFLHENKEKIEAAYNLLSDSRSRQVLEYGIKFYYTGKLEYLFKITDDKDEIFNEILRLDNNESYIDLGAYRGDTIDELIHYGGGYNKIIAVEPDVKTYKKLCKHIENMPDVTAIQKTIWKDDRKLCFSNQKGRGSAIATNGVLIDSVCIDTLSEQFIPTYIKIDVEGAEKQAIAGAVKTLSEYKPKLNVAAYHTFNDLFELVLMVNAINPEYKFYLRHHPYIPLWDTNLYCI